MPDRRPGDVLPSAQRAVRQRCRALRHLPGAGAVPGLGAAGGRLSRGLGRHHATRAAGHAGRLAGTGPTQRRPGRRRARRLGGSPVPDTGAGEPLIETELVPSSEKIVETPRGPALVRITEPAGPARSQLFLGHGAGGGVDAPDLVAVHGAAVTAGVRVLLV